MAECPTFQYFQSGSEFKMTQLNHQIMYYDPAFMLKQHVQLT